MPENPPSNRPNRPASGAYGEKKKLADLTSQLPPAAKQAAGPAPLSPGQRSVATMTTPPKGVGRPAGFEAPTGVPQAIMTPGQLPLPFPGAGPQLPPGQPTWMDQAIVAAATAQERRLAILDALANNPMVSQETREWAATVIRLLLAGAEG